MKKVYFSLGLLALVISAPCLRAAQSKIFAELHVPKPVELSAKVTRFVDKYCDEQIGFMLKMFVEPFGASDLDWIEQGSSIHLFLVDTGGEAGLAGVFTPREGSQLPAFFQDMGKKQIDGKLVVISAPGNFIDSPEHGDLLASLMKAADKFSAQKDNPNVQGDVFTQIHPKTWLSNLNKLKKDLTVISDCIQLAVVNLIENTEEVSSSISIDEDKGILIKGLLKVLPNTPAELLFKSFTVSAKDANHLGDLSYPSDPLSGPFRDDPLNLLGFIGLDEKKFAVYTRALAAKIFASFEKHDISQARAKNIARMINIFADHWEKYGGKGMSLIGASSGGGDWVHLTIRKLNLPGGLAQSYLESKDKLLRNAGYINRMIYAQVLRKPELLSNGPMPIYKMKDRKTHRFYDWRPGRSTYAAEKGQLIFISDINKENLIKRVAKMVGDSAPSSFTEQIRIHFYPQAFFFPIKKDADILISTSPFILTGKVKDTTLSLRMEMSKEAILELKELAVKRIGGEGE